MNNNTRSQNVPLSIMAKRGDGDKKRTMYSLQISRGKLSSFF